MRVFEILYLTGNTETVVARYMSFMHDGNGGTSAYHFHGRTKNGPEHPFLMINPVTVAEVREVTEVIES